MCIRDRSRVGEAFHAWIERRFLTAPSPVSYTHLDVYKRQIYGWRGAAASNIITFPASFPRADGEPALAYPLTVNRRSGQVILDAANALAASLRSDPELRWDGIDVDLVAPDGTPPGEITAATFDTQHGEVAWVADRIVASHDSALVPSWRDIAVLTRRNSTIRPLYAALVARGVPVEIVGLDGLLEVPEVADVVAMLRVLGDVTANPDVVRVLTGCLLYTSRCV